MTLQEEITEALADVPGANPRIWTKSVLDARGPERRTHVFWFLHRLCFFVETPEPSATDFDELLINLADHGAFIRCVENRRQVDAALETLKRIYCRKETRCHSKTTNSAPCRGSHSTAATS
jgi:hypothetical protein